MIASILAGSLAPAAHAFEFSPVIDFPDLSQPRRRADVLLSVVGGYDTNVGRSPAGSESADSDLEVVAGLNLVGRTSRSSLDLGCEYRAERHGSRDEFDFDENILKAGFAWRTRKAAFSLAGRLASLADPVDVETLDFSILRRTETFATLTAGLTLGKTELGVGYRSSLLDHEEASLGYLDHGDSGFEAEIRVGRPEAMQYFVHFDSGGIDYDVFDPAHPRPDFDYQRIYLGWRSRTETRSAVEFGAGTQTAKGTFLPGGSVIYVTASAVMVRQDGASALEAAYSRGVEAAATADCKLSSRVLARYSKKVNPRERWYAGVRWEGSEFLNPEDPAAGTLAVTIADVGIEYAVGSPYGWHGKLYAGLTTETGDAYDRLRARAGLAVTY